MKAAVFYEKGKILVEDHECRHPKADEVLIRVKAAGVCGTDMHIYGGAKGASECYPPVILGHEFAGIVAEVGENVKKVKVGDHVTVDPSIMCNNCWECQIGTPHFCEGYSATGVTYDGGFAEYCTVLEKQVYRLKEDIPFEEAAMCEPVGCCLHGIDRAHIKAGDVVLIIGGGTIGLIMMQLAKISGASVVIVSEPMEAKRKMALELGADYVVNPMEEDLFEVLKLNQIRKVNVSIECVGRAETMKDAVKYAGQGARIVFFGVSDPDCEIPIKPYEIFQRELTITASYVNPFTHGRAVELINNRKLKLKELISDIIPLDEIETAFEIGGKNGKMMIIP
ncbi:zinc-dependent alcohol dehydrogenase family protein [Faecalicatena contorta]|uniref:2-desacetyl-2-hydroxyethyl bacteriochlorophyllide A dehydrogenase n=1 Tax=Faecalicatena contorta TaxID=39482 RepID=A0A316A3E3_9FIRM|nr:zinc-dependent alcohol dehydrogenase family protein [Faecalicatena contorta]PWJ51254.1 2-desacetyl-2-hydroxyethyl bacteriochlorophyllide A dehydrogenase [Faecalicatena contorta]SUQ12810.1 2-desacetyl-2-hydroxyethyl bacteriochlorophyllide A dehydrogenase [Faecalicatena contorta]